MVLGTLLGCGSALVLGYSRRARRWLLPVLIASQAIPVFAIAPLLVLWLGYGMGSKITMAMLIIYFPVTANFYDGLRHTQRGWLDLAQVMLTEPRRWALLWHIAIPAALPALASGLRVAAAIATQQFFVKSADPPSASQNIRRLQIREEKIELGIHVGGDAMSHFSGGAAEFDAGIMGSRAHPKGSTVFQPFGTPEADMVTLFRTVPDRLFKSQILFAPEYIQIAHRGIRIRLVQDGVDHDACAAAKTQCVSGAPACGGQCLDDFLFAAHQGEVQWVAGHPVRCMREPRPIDEVGMALGLPFSPFWQRDVGDE